MDNLTKQLVLRAGFKVFGNEIVAADDHSSGAATDCTQALIKQVALECINIAMHYTNVDDAVPVIKLHFGIKE
jgi:hypothetical protein